MSIVLLALMCSSTVLSPIVLVSCSSATPIKETQAGRDAIAQEIRIQAIEARQKAGEIIAAEELAASKAETERVKAALAEEKAKSVAEDAKVDSVTGAVSGVAAAAAPYAPVPWGSLIAAQIPSLMGLVGLVVKEFTSHKNNVDNIAWLEKRLDDAEKRIQASAVAVGLPTPLQPWPAPQSWSVGSQPTVTP